MRSKDRLSGSSGRNLLQGFANLSIFFFLLKVWTFEGFKLTYYGRAPSLQSLQNGVHPWSTGHELALMCWWFDPPLHIATIADGPSFLKVGGRRHDQRRVVAGRLVGVLSGAMDLDGQEAFGCGLGEQLQILIHPFEMADMAHCPDQLDR